MHGGAEALVGATWMRRYLSAILAASTPTHLFQLQTIVTTSATESIVKRDYWSWVAGSSRSISASIDSPLALRLFENYGQALHHNTRHPHSYRNRLR